MVSGQQEREKGDIGVAIRSYRDLQVWQKGIELAQDVYRLTRKFPRHEVFGIGGQMQRAAVSVPSNIAEGQARRHTAEFRQFLFQALGSLAEIDTQLLLSRRLGYLGSSDTETSERLIVDLRRMIHALVLRLPKTRGRSPGIAAQK